MASQEAPDNDAFVQILEQPAKNFSRFRYGSESLSKLYGAQSTAKNKTFVTLQIMNCRRPVTVIASCVTKDKPYRPHPHKLVGGENCRYGIWQLKLNSGNMICQLCNVGIQCVKKNDIRASLQERQSRQVDPFATGFDHNPQDIDLHAVKLCFQAFIEGSKNGKFISLPPVVSDTIINKNVVSELTIVKLSSYSGPVTGGNEIILLCSTVSKDDIQIRFYEERNCEVVWEEYGNFRPSDIYKKVAITFKTPAYHNQNIQQPVEVFLQLQKLSDMSCGDPRIFLYTPRDLDVAGTPQKCLAIATTSFQNHIEQNTGIKWSIGIPAQCHAAAATNVSKASRRIKVARKTNQEHDATRVLSTAHQQYQSSPCDSYSTSHDLFSSSFDLPSTDATPGTSFGPSTVSSPLSQSHQRPSIVQPQSMIFPGPASKLSGAVGNANYGNEHDEEKEKVHIPQRLVPTEDQILNTAYRDIPLIDCNDIDGLLQSNDSTDTIFFLDAITSDSP